MFKNKVILSGAAALAGLSPALADSHIEVNIEPTELDSQFNGFDVPCHFKVPEKCPKNPIEKNMDIPILKNGIPPEFSKNGISIEAEQALSCIHLLEAHVDHLGIQPVAEENIELAENCLEIFAQGLLE